MKKNAQKIKHKLKVKPAKTLQFNTDDLKKFINPENKLFIPPEGDIRQKQLNLIMGCVVVIRLYDRQVRRVSQKLSDLLADMREAIETMNDEAIANVSKELCYEMINVSPKTSPISLESLKIVLLCLADLGLVNPHYDVTEEIRGCRSVMYHLSQTLSKQVEASAKANPETPIPVDEQKFVDKVKEVETDKAQDEAQHQAQDKIS